MPKKEAFTVLPHRVTKSKTLKGLSVYSRWVFVTLLTEWKSGTNQKERPFRFTYADMREATGFNYNVISRSFSELQKANLIDRVSGGLERNANQFVVNYDWLALVGAEETEQHKAPEPIQWTNETHKGLTQANAMTYEAALNLRFEAEKFY